MDPIPHFSSQPTQEANSLLPYDRSQMNYYHNRFHRLGDINDLDKDIEYKTQGLPLSPEGDPCLLGQLGESYHCRFKHTGSPIDLEHSIEYITLAVALSPDGHSHLHKQLERLSIYHHERFHLTGTLDDLDKDIEYKTRAVSLNPGGNPPLIAALGQSYRNRFLRLGNITDLERGIEYGRLAVSFSENTDPELLWRLHQLGSTYQERFDRLNDPSDIDGLLQCQARAIALIPNHEDQEDLPGRLGRLSASYYGRYLRLHEFDDLEKAIEDGVRSLSLAGSTSTSKIIVLINLSRFYSTRFDDSGDPGDLEKGMEYNACAYSLMDDSHPHAGFRLHNLGSLYHTRFEHLHDNDDLELAIESSALAVSLSSAGDTDPSSLLYLDNLAHYIHARWHHLGHANDLDKDIEHKTRAISLTPNHHPSLPARLESLGRSYWGKQNSAKCWHQYANARRLASDCFRRACLSEVGSPSIKLKSARAWASSSLNLNESMEAYQASFDLIPHAVWLGSTISQRYREISQVTSLASEAAATAIMAKDYARALEWLEQGRSIVMNQSLMLRSPLDQLHSVDSSLARRLQSVAEELHITSSWDPGSHDIKPKLPGETPEEIALQHRQLTKKYAELISQARQLPSFEDFLKPKKAAELTSAARTGPIIVINFLNRGSSCSPCDALVVQPGNPDIAHVALSAFDPQAVANILSRFDAALIRGRLTERGVSKLPAPGQMSELEHVLAMLWRNIVKPVIDFLGYKPNPPPEDLPHITWCATGSLSSLPLHAAGIYRGSQTCIADYAISSYTPNLTTLLFASPNATASSILAVGQEQTSGHCWLPGSSQELAHIQEHVNTSGSVSCTRILDTEATSSAVLTAMEQHDCVHFACHAHQNIKDPTKSGFFLHNDTLDLLSIMQRSFKNKGLAFLSACQTAKGDGKLPDETIHLASGMLTAGYPSVIAAMWSVRDKDAPFVANKVYGMLLKDGKIDCRESARALHYAVVELRKQIGDDQFTRWVPFIHLGS